MDRLITPNPHDVPITTADDVVRLEQVVDMRAHTRIASLVGYARAAMYLAFGLSALIIASRYYPG